MTTEQPDFWKPQPKPPHSDLRAWSLLVPACASAIGFFAFSVLAFGFTELDVLSADFRRTLVIVGAFALAFGGEVGTLATVVEIFRKNGAAQAWDWIGLAVSVCSTLVAFVLAFAALLGVQATWGPTVKLYGPIVLGVLAALDAYAGFMELGLYLSQHDERMLRWERARERYDKREYDWLLRELRAETATEAGQQAELEQTEPAEPATWPCTYPQCGRSFKTRQALNAHLGWHKRARSNGHGATEPAPAEAAA